MELKLVMEVEVERLNPKEHHDLTIKTGNATSR